METFSCWMWIFLLFACVESTTKPIIEPSNEGVVLKDNDNDGYLEDEDCDDDNPAINSSQIEICDGVDRTIVWKEQDRMVLSMKGFQRQ